MSHRVSPGEGPSRGRTATGQLLLDAAQAAITACGGALLVERALATSPNGRGPPVYLAGAGKAVGAMALGALRVLGDRARPGVLIGKHDEPALAGFHLRLAGHPIPDARGVRATVELMDWLGALPADAEVLFLLSGGASALLAAPLPGLSLDDLAAATAALLASGAPIDEINTVRRHLGRALGGRLAAGTRAHLDVLALSDVIGDDPAAIGSGPASADPSTFADALAVARRAALTGPALACLERGVRGEEEETLKPGDPRLGRVRHRILAGPRDLRDAALAGLLDRGRATFVETALATGEVDALADRYVHLARALPPGVVLVAVGEPTVPRPARSAAEAPAGGRAQHLALAMARRIAGSEVTFLAVGSDGTDGPTDAAGALVDGSTWARARAFDPDAALATFTSHPLLERVGALVRTGSTGTNLLDLHLLAR